ncbi:hypothetical protein MBLNU13_g11229t1 [Cladosporium sp. NU13]
MDSINWPQNLSNTSNNQTTTSYTSSSFNSGGGSFSFEGFPSFQSFSEPSFTSHTESYSSNSSTTFYLASVSNGHVLAHQENSRPSGVVVENKGDRSDEQKWTVEYGDEPDTIALKCAANDKYLHCFEGKSWGKVGTGEKQWWKISNDDVSAPGACRIGPVDFPDVYLNHHSGNTVRRGAAGAKVHMYKWEQNNERHTSWYFVDTSASFKPAASASSYSSASKADFNSKLKALEDREAALAHKDGQRSSEWEKKMKEVQERQHVLAQEEKDRAESYEKKLQEIHSREAELAKKEESESPESDSRENDPGVNSNETQAEEVKEAEREREADIQRKLDDLKSTEQKIAADRASLGKSKADFTAKLEWFQQRQKSFEDQKSSAQHDAIQAKKDLEQHYREIDFQKPPGSRKCSQHYNSQNGIQDSDLQKKQRENADLEKRLAKLEDQLSRMSGQSGHTKVNGTVSEGAQDCGYRHYKPPRKLNRKVIGFVYA